MYCKNVCNLNFIGPLRITLWAVNNTVANVTVLTTLLQFS